MSKLDKKALSEQDICTKFITPAVEQSGWDKMLQMRQEYSFDITDGAVQVRGSKAQRGKRKRVDYLLYHSASRPIAVIEAKDNNHTGHGMQQALEYAEMLDVPFVFSSNGDGFLFHDRTDQSSQLETELTLSEFPKPADLWRRFCQWKGLDDWKADLLTAEFHDDGSGKTPRYYQVNAINRVTEAYLNGDRRILLLMATGTGKTYTAFQIIWRLWKAGKAKRILFLADRNILVNQTINGDFKPFKNAMAKLSTRAKTIERRSGQNEDLPIAINKRDKLIDKSYEIYLGLYQSLTGPDEAQKIFKQFQRIFLT